MRVGRGLLLSEWLQAGRLPPIRIPIQEAGKLTLGLADDLVGSRTKPDIRAHSCAACKLTFVQIPATA